MIIAFTGDITRFTTGGRYATYTATAPIEFSFGGRRPGTGSRRGNRRLN